MSWGTGRENTMGAIGEYDHAWIKVEDCAKGVAHNCYVESKAC